MTSERIRRGAALTVVLGSALTLSACSPAILEHGTYIVDCNTVETARPDGDALQLLSHDVYQLGGWNHINGVGSFENVARGVGEYKITAANWLPDESCTDLNTLQTTLVKTTYNWDKQHANGFEARFPTAGLTFGDITDVVLEFRIRPEDTYIPSQEELAAAYGDLLTDAQLADLDQSMVNLEITLYGMGATADQPFMNAGIMVSVDPAEFDDLWVRVQIPREDFYWYTIDTDERTPVTIDDWQDLGVGGALIVPETHLRNTVRHLIPDEFDGQLKPELFKELGLTFALIEIGRVAPTEE